MQATNKVVISNLNEVVEKADNYNIHWKNDNYDVIGTTRSNMLIRCKSTQHCIGLFYLDNVNSDYKPNEFYYYN